MDARLASAWGVFGVGVTSVFGLLAFVVPPGPAPWWAILGLIPSCAATVIGFALLFRQRWEQRPHLAVEGRVAGQEWLRLTVTNTGRARPVTAHIVKTEGAEPEPAVPRAVRWTDWESEVRRIEKGQTCLLDLAEADPMGGEGLAPWRQGEPIAAFDGWGRFRFHGPREWVPLRVTKPRNTSDLYERQFVVIVEVRSGAMTTRTRVSLGYDNMLNILSVVSDRWG